MFEFSYNSETNVIIITHSGTFELEQLQKLKEELSAEYHELTEVNILIDYRSSRFNFGSNTLAMEVGEMIDLIPSETDPNPPLRIACLPGNTENRVVNHLYQLMTADLKDYDYKLFDSHEEALRWLENP